jgi:putative inorganic carbon (hco3(-)) transporter
VRDYLVTMIVLGGALYALRYPFVGILLWCWLGYMNPHRLTYGFAYDIPFALIVGAVTLIGLFVSREPKRLPMYSVTVVWLLFLGWTLITTVFALYPEVANPQCVKVLKIQLFIFISMLLVHDRKRMDLLIGVIALSIAFYGVRGGLHTLFIDSSTRVYGPPGSFIEDNASLAVALLMVVPLLRYFQLQTSYKWVRRALWPVILLSMVAALGSQSRGALIALGAMVFVLWTKSRQKFLLAAVLAAVLPVMYQFMPDSWHERMGTIETYNEDASAMGRLFAWRLTINLADQRITGGGYEPWFAQTVERYGDRSFDVSNTENPDKVVEARAAHSIYFSVLGEHGWIGLALFIAVGVLAWRSGSWVLRETKQVPELAWLRDLAAMLQVSLIAYATGGAFLSLSYFDLYWQLAGVLVVCRAIASQELTARVPATASPDHLPQIRPDMTGA